ncbi:hypothetical protein TTHERM_00146430 (macronuclear) [Tetrahymena thermophila SB210]|uniref:Uncharacterized protein n=1 Tax=Tetrahymena thermophila (strain SB210) TaxID=312017 RepID=I7MIA3_TETTS|nr:hypothetical protein TTHERM_00146430 [Tetrahymena thermophila SB210]EAR91037.1 hypothetical protein TTHERM_00146430 [Tetrahymena thermophila SB210]|eukprot:XP_001011282.1 hypothetical protein TTHERM_00146430 [Tetrahymena thermophila SB210]
MSSNESEMMDDVEFYSFIQVNEDLSNSQEQSSQVIYDNHQQILQDQKEINLSTQNVGEEQFFKKLSQAFYSTQKDFSKTQKKNSIIEDESQNLQSKLNCLENQNTQPQTPKSRQPTKSEDQLETKSHHLLKNYQIKKIQKHPQHIDLTTYESSSIKKQQAPNLTSTDYNLQQNSEFNFQDGISITSDNQKGKKLIFIQKNAQNNIGNTENNQENQYFNQQQNNKFIQTQFNQPNQRYSTNQEIIQSKPINHRLIIQNKNPENGLEKQRLNQLNLNIQREKKADEIETIILNESQEMRNNLQKKQINLVYKNKQDLLNELQNNQFEQNDLKNHYQWQPLSSRPALNTNNTTNIQNSVKTNQIENNFFEISDNQQKQHFINQKRQIQVNNNHNNFNKNEVNQSSYNYNPHFFKRNSVQEKVDEVKSNFINTPKQVLNDRNKDEKANKLNTMMVLNQNQIIQNDNDLRQRIKDALNNKFTPQQKKSILLSSQKKGLTTPRQLLNQNTNGFQTLQSKQNLMSNLQFNNNNNNIDNILAVQHQTPLSNRELVINNQSQIENNSLKKIILQRPQKQINNTQNKLRLNQNNQHIQVESNIQIGSNITQSQPQSSQNYVNQNSINLTNSLKFQIGNSIKNQINQDTENINNKSKNNFFSQVIKSKTIQNLNKYQTQNELTKLPLSNSQKLIEYPQQSQGNQNFNNLSLKNIASQKAINLITQSGSKKKTLLINQNQKVESIYTANFEQEYQNSQRAD